jgi:hypothetical protein
VETAIPKIDKASPQTSGFRRTLLTLVSIAASAGVTLLVALLWSESQNGGLRAALAAWNGSVLVPERSTYSMGSVEGGARHQADFQIHNVTSNPVKVIGGEPDCSCVALTGLPLQIAAHSTKTLRIEVTPSERHAGPFEHHVYLHLDTDSPSLILTVEGVSAPAVNDAQLTQR